MALIDSSMFGIPFEGYDYYQNETGGMKGVIAKAITLFDQTGADMDKACFQAVWNYPDGDFVYFDGVISEVSYGYVQ